MYDGLPLNSAISFRIDLLYKSQPYLSTESAGKTKLVQIVSDSTLKVSVVHRSALMGCPGLFFLQVPPQKATSLR